MSPAQEDFTLLQGFYLANGRYSPLSRLYYYQGNFFKPLEVDGREAGRIKRAMRQFWRDNAPMIRADQARPGYRNLVQLAEDQGL